MSNITVVLESEKYAEFLEWKAAQQTSKQSELAAHIESEIAKENAAYAAKCEKLANVHERRLSVIRTIKHIAKEGPISTKHMPEPKLGDALDPAVRERSARFMFERIMDALGRFRACHILNDGCLSIGIDIPAGLVHDCMSELDTVLNSESDCVLGDSVRWSECNCGDFAWEFVESDKAGVKLGYEMAVEQDEFDRLIKAGCTEEPGQRTGFMAVDNIGFLIDPISREVRKLKRHVDA